jgi:hypothetical protein
MSAAGNEPAPSPPSGATGPAPSPPSGATGPEGSPGASGTTEPAATWQRDGQARGGASAPPAGRPTVPGEATAGLHAGAWASELSERVIDGVARLKARTTLPVVRVLRGLIYGLAAIVALFTAFVLVVVGVVRIWDAYVPVGPLTRRVWLGYLVLGGAIFLAGGVLVSRRRARQRRS